MGNGSQNGSQHGNAVSVASLENLPPLPSNLRQPVAFSNGIFTNANDWRWKIAKALLSTRPLNKKDTNGCWVQKSGVLQCQVCNATQLREDRTTCKFSIIQ